MIYRIENNKHVFTLEKNENHWPEIWDWCNVSFNGDEWDLIYRKANGNEHSSFVIFDINNVIEFKDKWTK